MLSLPEQGCSQCYRSAPRGRGHVAPSCCISVSKARIKERISSCYEQKDTFARCKIHAFILVTVNKNSIVWTQVPNGSKYN
ncbi:hypothetical protein Q5P01_023917 [Channa striata]|uniref:Uncharacterized protein n=1 Tax=Channa striata TaxID=64152 RepID=A0AA88JAU5_CHASR|nr:hypothetical protein Q5P01_023917 [Channa striata]